MGKQRTPQGRSAGRRTPPNKPVAAVTAAAPAAPPETVQAVVPEVALHPAEDAFPAGLPEAAPEPLHAHLMDTVSPEALGAATPPPEPHAAAAERPVPADANLAEPLLAAAPESTEIEPDAGPISSAEPAVVTAPAPEAPPVYTNVVPLKSAAPARPPEPAEAAAPDEAPAQLSDGALPAPASWRAGRRPVAPLRRDLEGMGETLLAFMRSESSAVLTHLNALKDARSPADAIRLQVNEIQRAADASLTCWSEIARRATRIVAQR